METQFTGCLRQGAIAAVLAASLTSAPVQAKAPQVETLAPAMPWNVDWQKSSCVLRRVFGPPEALFYLHFERFAPGDGMQVLLTGKHLRGLQPPAPISVAYGDGGSVHASRTYLAGALKDGTPSIFLGSSVLRLPMTGAARITPAMEDAIQQITIQRPGRQFVLQTGPLGKAFAALRKCTDQLVSSWGLDPVQQGNLTRLAAPLTPPDTWLSSNDYPVGALAGGGQAIVNFRLTVGADGKPTACEIQKSYSGSFFEALSCKLLMKRAAFAPALDTAGQPAPSYYINTIRWVIRR